MLENWIMNLLFEHILYPEKVENNFFFNVNCEICFEGWFKRPYLSEKCQFLKTILVFSGLKGKNGHLFKYCILKKGLSAPQYSFINPNKFWKILSREKKKRQIFDTFHLQTLGPIFSSLSFWPSKPPSSSTN